MSWEASGFVKKLMRCPDGAELSRGQKFLMLTLADYHDTRKQLAWPSVPTLAEETLGSRSQIKRDLAYLEEHLALVRRRTRDGSGSTYAYKFVGLDLSIDEARKFSEGVHAEPFFSPAKRGPQEVRKGSKTEPKRGPEGVQTNGCNKEEPEPKTQPKSHEQHAASGAMTEAGREALRVWLETKRRLLEAIGSDEFDYWVRPAMLLKVMSGRLLLIALPASGSLVLKARERRALLEDLLARDGYGVAGFTSYPDDYTRERMRKEYPEFYDQMYGNVERAG